jgi:hypothetical protein
MHTKFWSESLKGRDSSEDVGIDGKVILLGKYGGKVWTAFIGLRIQTSMGLL